ncbi:hypothetical protein CDAR_94551 [Caerostris darwini]|uniref:Uncharacterized protein n=1 Tax=Caerostris darwini TaxID=1538125 RepID=A0AAV4NEU1_9ARAC|nr:hypothetical protein CDAR_94551 [Caerostris darwini]
MKQVNLLHPQPRRLFFLKTDGLPDSSCADGPKIGSNAPGSSLKRKQGTPETHFSVRKEDLHKRNEEKASAGDNERVFFQEKSAANGEEREKFLCSMTVLDHVRGFLHQGNNTRFF